MFWAYTLVELLIALALSMILLIGVTELFSRVSSVMSETRATLNLSANLDGVELLLRQDLARIQPKDGDDRLTIKPGRMIESIASPGTVEVEDFGYLEIVEGPNHSLCSCFDDPSSLCSCPNAPCNDISCRPYVNEKKEHDPTVGDVDDIFAFTAKADPATPFRGLIDGKLAERNYAEIVWFVRGNTLYRRIRLIDDQSSKIDPTVNSMAELALRERRFGRSLADTFPCPLYDNANPPTQSQYYLRMPTLEEVLHDPWHLADWRDPPTGQRIDNPDLWEQPHFFPASQDRKSGSLTKYVSTPRHHRAGEDIVLTNVLSFDIKVWCPDVRDFVDLGTTGTTWATSNQPALPRTWDSWSVEYATQSLPDPPFIESLEAIRITIRCFDPASRIIKQTTVVHKF